MGCGARRLLGWATPLRPDSDRRAGVGDLGWSRLHFRGFVDRVRFWGRGLFWHRGPELWPVVLPSAEGDGRHPGGQGQWRPLGVAFDRLRRPAAEQLHYWDWYAVSGEELGSCHPECVSPVDGPVDAVGVGELGREPCHRQGLGQGVDGLCARSYCRRSGREQGSIRVPLTCQSEPSKVSIGSVYWAQGVDRRRAKCLRVSSTWPPCEVLWIGMVRVTVDWVVTRSRPLAAACSISRSTNQVPTMIMSTRRADVQGD